jgi:hypothetical protein
VIVYHPHFDRIIADTVQNGNAGCFRMKFDYGHPVLMISQWFTRFNHISCRGGDQSLFITKELFKENKGFDENLSFMRMIISSFTPKKTVCHYS